MDRIGIINSLIKKNGYKSYLEIGCQNDVCFNQIQIEHKVGVDPEKGGTLRMTSDEFFDNLFNSEENSFVIHLGLSKFDIIFVDGLHEEEQVLRDIENALKCLNPGGVIICHDMNPQSELAQRVPREIKQWNGDCWKAIVKLQLKQPSLEVHVVDTDHGCGIIRQEKKFSLRGDLLIEEELTYENLAKNRVLWLNLITVEQFKTLYL